MNILRKCASVLPQWSLSTYIRISLMLLLGFGLCGFFYWFSSSGYLIIFLKWVKSLGYWGNLLFVLAFTIDGLPFMLAGYTPLGLACGFIYSQYGPILGILNGFTTVLVGTLLGSLLGFWTCRKLLKGWFQQRVNENPTLQAFMQAMESRGFYLILIMRMAPIPFGVQNGLFSISNVSGFAFGAATIIGLIPEILMLVYMGTTMRDLASIATGDFEFDVWQKVVLGVEIGMTVILCILLVWLSREAMRKVHQSQMANGIVDEEEVAFGDTELGSLQPVEEFGDELPARNQLISRTEGLPPIAEDQRQRLLSALDPDITKDDSDRTDPLESDEDTVLAFEDGDGMAIPAKNQRKSPASFKAESSAEKLVFTKKKGE